MIDAKNFEWTDENVCDFFRWLPKRMIDRDDAQHAEGLIDSFKQFKKEQLSKRDWEIVSYEVAGNIYIVENHDKDYCNVNGNMYFQRIKISDLPATKQIHSIRRLSDGEVFCVGDEAGSRYSYDSFIIEKIEIKDEPHLMAKGWLVPLQNARKVKKQVLFTTSDGKKIYKGDEYWYVVTSDYDCLSGIKWEALNSVADWDGGWNNRVPLGGKQFGSEAAALDYILMNKPMLSLKEILDNFYSWEEFKKQCLSHSDEFYKNEAEHSPLFKRLKQLAKSKIDKK